MEEKTRLHQMILSHWQQHRPQMVEEMRVQNQLEQAISEAEAWTADILYEFYLRSHKINNLQRKAA